MYSHRDLVEEIQSVMSEAQKTGTRVIADWVTQTVLNNHTKPESEDADFWIICARRTVREEVRRAIGRYDLRPSVDADRQIVLPGFERLQTMYAIEQNGEQVGVPVEEMTDAEFDAKRNELRAMGAGCFQHEAEMARYQAMRRMQRLDFSAA